MKTLLVPIDFSRATGPVLEVASALARSLRAKIVLVNVLRPAVVMDDYSPLMRRLAVAAGKTTRERLMQWKNNLQNEGLIVETTQLYGPPAGCIREEAARLEADYIVVGSHGLGAQYTAAVGSTAGGLLKKAPCPVIVVPVTGLKPVLIDIRAGSEAQPSGFLSCCSAG